MGDIRDVTQADCHGIDAVVHLAALSNDPLGALNPGLTTAINTEATVRLATHARAAGVRRFLFMSSCSVYGETPEVCTVRSPLAPLTEYARSKAAAERALQALATDTFRVVILRGATVYGLSPSMRLDLVINELAAQAVATGHLELTSDGAAWRPFVHIDDVADTIQWALDGDPPPIFHVGGSNATISDVVTILQSCVPGLTVHWGPIHDRRSYLVEWMLGHSRPRYEGITSFVAALRNRTALAEDLKSARYRRLSTLQSLQERGLLDVNLRWYSPPWTPRVVG